jgi:Holliday junction resolvase RusA-like endonuclease
MLRAHWGQKRKDKESWREHVRKSCGERKRRFLGKVKLSILVYRRTRQDPDNAYASVKHLLDALVKEGWLQDDSPEFLSLRVLEREEPRKVEQRTEMFWKPLRNGLGKWQGKLERNIERN